MKDVLLKILGFLGVTSQFKTDLATLLQLALVYFLDAESEVGSGNGQKKKDIALDSFFTEVAKEGGIDLPGSMTKPIARKLFGFLLDFLASLTKGEEPKN